MDSDIITVRAPINIAVIKYWGKRDEELILPLNDSLSLTLDTNTFYACTTVVCSPRLTEDKIWVNGKEEDIKKPRLQNCINELRKRAPKTIGNGGLHICSENNFPTAAGLASSAAGFSALVYAVAKVLHIKDDVSDIARLGSGSACRSLYGGFVHWAKGNHPDGSDCLSKQIFPSHHWPELMILILIVNEDKKDNSSTSGMQQSVRTSELLPQRINQCVPERLKIMIEAIHNKDFETFAIVTMKESNQLHAVCLDTYPPCLYLNQTSHSIIKFVHAYNNIHAETKVAYTFDAGANAFLFVEEHNYLHLCSSLRYIFPSEKQDFFLGRSELVIPDLSMKFQSEINTCIPLMPNAVSHVVTCSLGQGIDEVRDATGHLLTVEGVPKNLCSA